MQTLQQCYEEIAINEQRWSYYENSIDINNKWTNNKEAFEFIKQYFEYAGKSKVFKDENIEKYHKEIENRAGHTISTFLLGIKIADCFELDTFTRDDNNMNFKYYWFLTCLYHDVGYIFENRNYTEQLVIVQKEGIEGLQEIFGIKHIHERIFKTYSKVQIEIYLKKRSEDEGDYGKVLDHGIVGGLLLYDKLRKQFEIAWKRRTDINNCRDSFFVKDECNNRQLHLSKRHYEAYAKAADAIIAHNIWQSKLLSYMVTRDVTENNIKQKIDSIGIDNELCFILSLSDTLEPLKRGGQYLELISINSLVSEKGIELQMNKDVYNSIYQKIDSLEEWMKVKVSTKELVTDSIAIKITLA